MLNKIPIISSGEHTIVVISILKKNSIIIKLSEILILKIKVRFWELMNRLKIYKECQTENIENVEWLSDKLVNIPSSMI